MITYPVRDLVVLSSSKTYSKSNSWTSFSTAILCTFKSFDFVQSNGSFDTVPGCSEKVVVVEAGGIVSEAMIPIRLVFGVN